MLSIRAHSYKLTTTLNKSVNAKHEKEALEIETDCGAKKKNKSLILANLGTYDYFIGELRIFTLHIDQRQKNYFF